jgi:hypothetical protein
MQAVLEEANDSMNLVDADTFQSLESDLFEGDASGNETYQDNLDLSTELESISLDTLEISIATDQSQFEISESESRSDFSVNLGVKSVRSFKEEEFENTALEATSELSESNEISNEDQLYFYLKTCENGARLSQIESDLRFPRSKAVEAIRMLAKMNRLAQRDRHFFAID